MSALDASFLTAETPTAHLHVGWVAVFDPPRDGRRPGFELLRDHIQRRLARAPRYRQRLATVPLGVHRPLWIDDRDFDIDRHVLRAESGDLGAVVARAMSSPLARSRPLWECWIAGRLADGRIGVVGKAHHAMVDGLAAVELASLLLDPTPDPPSPEPDGWCPAAAPGRLGRLARGVRDRVREDLDVVGLPARLVSSPDRVGELVGDARRAAAALADSLLSPAHDTPCLNPAISAQRHLALLARPVSQLVAIKAAFDTTLNDVVLAACAGGVGRFLQERGEPVPTLKAMVPVSVRHDGERAQLGNRISFMFVPLPCAESDPVRQLAEINRLTTQRKAGGVPRGAETVLNTVGRMPHVVQRALTRLVASPRTFNLAISNVPGPRAELWMAGCELREAYPVVPLAERHALSIGVMTLRDHAFFGLYADRKTLPDVDSLAHHTGAAIDELLQRIPPAANGRPPRPKTPPGQRPLSLVET